MKISQKITFLVFACFLFSACGGSTSGNDANNATVTKQDAAGSADFQETVEQFRALVPKAVSADFVFYTDFGSASSGVEDPAQLGNFGTFITGQPGTNPLDCDFEGASVLYDNEGNILCEMDFVLTAGCSHVRLRMNNEYSIHQFSPGAITYFSQFMKVIKGMNTPSGQG